MAQSDAEWAGEEIAAQQRRITRGRTYLALYAAEADQSADIGTVATDLIADILHALADEGADTDRPLAQAREHLDAELAETGDARALIS